MGSILFSLSAVVIAITTSFPVINKVFATEHSIANPEEWYNNSQMILGILLALLAAFSQFLVYKVGRPIKQLKPTLIVSLPASVVLTIALGFQYEIDFLSQYSWGSFISAYWLLLWSGILVSLTNAYYLIAVQQKRWKIWGSSLSHIGFGILLVRIIISQYKQQVALRMRYLKENSKCFIPKTISPILRNKSNTEISFLPPCSWRKTKRIRSENTPWLNT